MLAGRSFGVVVCVAVVDSELVGPPVDCDDERDARDEGDGAGGGAVCAVGEKNDLFAALNMATGTVITDIGKTHTSKDFVSFLKEINKNVPSDLDVHIILDNLSAHERPIVHSWLLRHPRFHFHFTPPYGSWMTMVERWFSYAVGTTDARAVVIARQANRAPTSPHAIPAQRGPSEYRALAMMGQIFAAFGALRPHDRFKLGAGLRAEFACFPVTTPEFVELSVPLSDSARATFLHGLHDALLPVLDGQISSWTIGQVVPRISALTDAIEISPAATNRLIALAGAHGYRTWGELADCTLDEIRSWFGAGQQTAARVVIAAVETAFRSAAGECSRQFSPDVTSRDAVSATLDGFLADLPDERGRFAFEFDELRLDRARATVDWSPSHEFLGLSLERTRQLKAVVRARLVAVSKQAAAVEQRVGELARRLGSATDHEGLQTVLKSLQLPATSDPAGLLAVWLAGPYRPVPRYSGWFSPHPIELLDETQALLSMGGGVHPYDVVIKDLDRIGVLVAHAHRWLAGQRVKIEHGLVVDLCGRVGDVAARVLEATGRTMDFSELQLWMSPEISASALANQLNRNPMFIETGPDRWELTDWGGEPSAHLVRIEVQVTSEVVSGADAALSSEVARSLHLRPGKQVVLATRFGPMAVAYDGVRVTRGSARPVVLASGAAIGDVLWFVIDPRDWTVEVTVVTSTDEPMTVQSTSTVRSAT